VSRGIQDDEDRGLGRFDQLGGIGDVHKRVAAAQDLGDRGGAAGRRCRALDDRGGELAAAASCWRWVVDHGLEIRGEAVMKVRRPRRQVA
jgi:hypothetical protein